MAKKKDAGLVAVVDLVDVLNQTIELVGPYVKNIIEKVEHIIEERKKLEEIPPLYEKNSPVTMEWAVAHLEGLGLKVKSIPIKEANIKYNDCLDSQVIGTYPKSGHKVEPGSLVYVRYVTPEIIEQSKKLFEEFKKFKAEIKLQKYNKKQEQKEKLKKMVDDTTVNIHHAVENITDNVKAQLQKITAKSDKNVKLIEQADDIIVEDVNT